MNVFVGQLPHSDPSGEVANCLDGVREEIKRALDEIKQAEKEKTVNDFQCDVASAIVSLEQAVRDLKALAG